MTTYCETCSGLVAVTGLLSSLPYPRKLRPVAAYEVQGALACGHSKHFISSPGQVGSFTGRSA